MYFSFILSLHITSSFFVEIKYKGLLIVHIAHNASVSQIKLTNSRPILSVPYALHHNIRILNQSEHINPGCSHVRCIRINIAGSVAMYSAHSTVQSWSDGVVSSIWYDGEL